MRHSFALVVALCLRVVSAGPVQQISLGLDVLGVDTASKKPAHVHKPHKRGGHLSDWLNASKSDFLKHLHDGDDIGEYVLGAWARHRVVG